MRQILDKLFPLGTKRRNFLFEIKKKVKKILENLYHLRCFNNGIKKNTKIIYNKKELEKLKPKKDEYVVYDKENDNYYLSQPLNNLNKKVAVHIHLYYEDLLDEFINYLNNIPYKFDIYCSISEHSNEKKIVNRLETVKNKNKIIVKKTKNQGRDYGPMMCEFGSVLKKYDYICHIHTKKTLRMGNSQDGWRLHLLEGTLGSETLIKNIFYFFEKEDIGIFFQDSYQDSPYWGNTWMGAKELGRQYLKLLGIPFNDKYQDFSVGSMFWLNTKAAKQVFDRKWKWVEFGNEEGQDDGTLAYVFERLFVLCSNYNKYDFICFNSTNNIMYKNFSERNMMQYYEKNIDKIVNKAKEYDIISFDIFDTLLTRKIYNPDTIFRIIENQIKDKIKLNKSFFELRKEAENSLRNLKNDPDLYEIYTNMKKINHLSQKDMNFLINLELEFEEKLLIPREHIQTLFDKIKNLNKDIIIVSDMYLPSEFIKKILKKYHFTDYKEIYLSCEQNKRKDNETLWNFLKEKYPNKKIMHIGDNEESDCHLLWKYNFYPEHIMSSKRMFENSSYGYKVKDLPLDSTISDSILYGLTINKTLFNNPFKWNKTRGLYTIDNLYEYGYSIIGPILLYFMIWLVKSLKEEKNKSLLFLSREGYYFEKLYNIIKSKCNCPWLGDIEENYFLASRRCVSIASLENIEDIYKILDTEYYGDLYSLLKNRFNLEVKDKNFSVQIHSDGSGNKEKVKNIISKYEQEILKNAKIEKENYLKYINKTIKNLENITVVDLGYSGTIQYYLSKLLDKKIDGKYLVVKNNPKPLKLGCKVTSCFNDIQNDNNHPIYKNSLLLEFFLTAPFGQLQYFDNSGNPIFLKEKLLKEKKQYLNKIYEGVQDLFGNFIDIMGKDLDNYNLNKEIITKIFEGFSLEANFFLNHNRKIFEFEDYYCRKEIMVLEKIR